MTVHNLQGVLKLQELGFKRVVLSRELSLQEIEYICKNSNIEIECFIHGALCISYSGQCLFSSMVGGRSGNRGKCAQPCRLPYKLLENDTEIDKGFLLSTRDLCGLDFIPNLIKAGVTCLKIEGRMKSPEYVATVTRIYRKYIDIAEKIIYENTSLVNDDTEKIDNQITNNFSEYKVDETDRKILLQSFNRGMSSNGHLANEPNKNLIFKEKPNNMGLFLGKVEKYNKNKGYITVKLQEPIEIGDTISLEKETGSYNVSELMDKNKNIKETSIGQTVTIGRMKGNINLGDKIYKLSSKKLNLIAQSNQAENNNNGDVEKTKNETQDTDNTVSKNETKQNEKNNETQQVNNEEVNAIKKCLKDEKWIKENVSLEFGNEYPYNQSQKYTFMIMKTKDNNPTVIVKAQREGKIKDMQAFIVKYKNKKVTAVEVDAKYKLSSLDDETDIIADPNNGLVNYYTDLENGCENMIYDINNETPKQMDIYGYYTGGENEGTWFFKELFYRAVPTISEEEYNSIKAKYDKYKFYKITTELTSENIDEYIK